MAEVVLAERGDAARAEARSAYFGVHHLALNTDDMKMTVDFYVGVLGMPLVHAMKVPPGLGTGPANRGNPPFEEIRHYFFDMGRDGLLAFFEMPEGRQAEGRPQCARRHAARLFRGLAGKPGAHPGSGSKRSKVPYDGPLEILPGIFSIYVFDPNDIRLEFSCQPGNGEGEPRIVPQVTQTRAEALQELRLRSTLRRAAGLAAATAGLRE